MCSERGAAPARPARNRHQSGRTGGALILRVTNFTFGAVRRCERSTAFFLAGRDRREAADLRRHPGARARRMWRRRLDLVGRRRRHIDRRRNRSGRHRRHIDRRPRYRRKRRLGRRRPDRRRDRRDGHGRCHGHGRDRRGCGWRFRTRWYRRDGKRWGRRRYVLHWRQRDRRRGRDRRCDEQRHLLRVAERHRQQLHQRRAVLDHPGPDRRSRCGLLDECRSRRQPGRRHVSARRASGLHGGRLGEERPHDHLASGDGRSPGALRWQVNHGMGRQRFEQEHLEGVGARCLRDAPAVRRRQARHPRAVLLDQPFEHDLHQQRLDVFEQQPQLFEQPDQPGPRRAEHHRIVDESLLGDPERQEQRGDDGAARLGPEHLGL